MFKVALLVLFSVFLFTTLALPASHKTFCAPLAFRDYDVGAGYEAIVRVAPGCKKPALVRKENRRSGAISRAIRIPVGKVVNFWLFTHRLMYSLDGKTWRPLEIR